MWYNVAMQQRIIKESELDYLSKVFKGLSGERKDYVLNTARSLLEIQDNNTQFLPIECIKKDTLYIKDEEGKYYG
jgi:hypothetical protein